MIKALDNVLQILQLKYRLFHQTNTKRYKPYPFKKAMFNETVEWLLTQCGSNNYNYSTQCQKLFTKLARYVDTTTCTSGGRPDQFISKYIEDNGLVNFILIIESSNQFQLSAEDYVFPNLLQWLEQLYVSLNCYHWLLKNSFVSVDKIFIHSGTFKNIVIDSTNMRPTHFAGLKNKIRAYLPHFDPNFI